MFSNFINKVVSDKYISNEVVLKALHFAKTAHSGQKRSSGQDFIVHPVAVSSIVLDYFKDTPSVVASLLHDVVEDTNVTLDEITKEFGGEIATLVEGVTKLSKISFRDATKVKTENLRKFILSISKDIRVLLIKLADRLHNLRTIKFITNVDKQKSIALETLEIYVPLAERIGLISIKDELEDLSFDILHSNIRDVIVQTLENYKTSIDIDLELIENEFKLLLSKFGVNNYSLKGRIKRPYSIWNKMQKNEIDFEEINDLVAFRVIVNNVEECYKVLGIIHNTYKSFFSSFRDYISVTKENGYQSIHTCILFKPALKVELQIRTAEMHKVAENGLAAHWNYKNKVKPYDMRDYIWLNNILEIVSSPFLGAKEKYEYSKLEMFDNEIFVFTPRGKIISLPKNSLVLDFAYAIHTDLGDTCIGAKINGTFVPAYSKLENGTTVKIITSPDKEPDINLINSVKTGSAVSNIRRYWRSKKKEKIEELIRDILQYTFKKEGLKYDDEIILKILEKYKLSTLEFYYGLLQGSITINEIIKEFYPQHSLQYESVTNLFEIQDVPVSSYKIYLADCCLPVKGDELKGIVSLGQTVIAHREDCRMLYSGNNKNLNKINIKWSKNVRSTKTFLTNILLEVTHKPGTLNSITKVFNDNVINIIDFFTRPYSSNIKVIKISFEVRSLKELNSIISQLEKLDVVKDVRREVYFN